MGGGGVGVGSWVVLGLGVVWFGFGRVVVGCNKHR